MQRRTFLLTPAIAAAQAPAPSWPNPVIDVHFHPRPTPEANAAHLDGCGVQRAVLLARIAQEAEAKAAIARYPRRFVRFTAMDATQLDLEALKKSARGLDAGGRHGRRFCGLDSVRTLGLHPSDWRPACFHARGCRPSVGADNK